MDASQPGKVCSAILASQPWCQSFNPSAATLQITMLDLDLNCEDIWKLLRVQPATLWSKAGFLDRGSPLNWGL